MRVVCVAVALALGVGACAHRDARAIKKASRDLGRAVKRGKVGQIRGAVVPGARPGVDVAAMTKGSARRTWHKSLGKPREIRPEAIVFITPDRPVRAQWTANGWRFAEDPTDVYSQSTPRAALRALVFASKNKRWDVLIRLAPKRYRMGLSEDDLENAWSEGEHARVLGAARDKVANHLADPIVADAHEAVLELGDGHVARLEREGDRWVVVDFLPESGAP